jgi:hypothetical protein
MTRNAAGRDFLSTVKDKFMSQHVDFATHNSEDILDLVLSTAPNLISSVN